MRTPITLKIKFKSSSLEQFIERYSVDVSRGGIFIRTKEPLPVGTTLRFEFQLQDSSSLIGGEGTVVWNRAYDPARTGVAPGMGVRFDKLTADSQRVLERILSEKHKRGEAQLESRFDAGVRASREARSHEFADAGTPLPSPVPGMGMHSSPGGSGGGSGGGGFGDEPTRMMAAEQMSQLAAEMQSAEDFAQDQPTRRASLDEIRRAVSATEPALPPGRTGSTGEQTRLRSGAAAARAPVGADSKTTSAMGVVDPRLAAGAVPASSSSQEIPLSPSLATRPVSEKEAAALIAASAASPRESQGEAQGVILGEVQDDRTPTPGSAPPLAPGQRALAEAAAQASTLVDAPVPPVLVPSGNGLAQTLASPPPAEVVDLLQQVQGGRGEEAPPSGISIGLDFDSTGETTAQSAPLDSAAFAPLSSAPPPPQRESKGEAKGAGPSQEASTGKVKAKAPVGPPERSGGARALVPIVGLLLAVAVAGVGIYALLWNKPDEAPKAPPQEVQAPPAPERPKAPPVEDKGPKVQPEKAGPEGDKGAEREPDKGQEPAEKGQEPAEKAQPGDGKGATPAAVDPTQKAAGPDKALGEGKKPEGAADKALPVVSVSSEPTGARVEVGGKPVGETPMKLPDVQVGKTYEIKLSLRGYQDARFKVKPQAGDNLVKVHKLVPYERVVEVNSTPRGAEVFLDGKRVGRTPMTLKRLDMSKIHEIEVRKGGFSTQTAKVADTDTFDVKGGREVRTLNLTLEAQAQPKGAGPEKAEPAAAPRPPTRRPATKDGEGRPEAAKPEAAKPEAAKPEAAKPEAAKPEAPAEPESGSEQPK